MIRLLVPFVLSALAAAQAPALGPELGPVGDLASTEGGGEQSAPYLAGGGDMALAVWIDHRAEFNSPLANQGSPDVFAIRVGADGVPLDGVALRMPDAVGDAQRVRAAWNGSAWLVVWENQKPDGTSPNIKVFLGARVSQDGTLLDSEPIEIATHGQAVGSSMGVGSDGTDWVVTMQGSPTSNTSVVGVRVLADGSVPSQTGVVLATTTTAIFDTSLAFGSGRYLLLYSNGTVSGRLLNPDLTPVGASFVIASGSNYHPRLASDGTNFMATWATQGSPDLVRVRGIVGASGTMTNPVLVSSASDYARDPSVAWSGSNWHVVFRYGLSNQEYRAARVSSNLTVLNPGGDTVPVSGIFGESRIVAGGTAQGAVLAYEEVILSELWPGAIRACAIDEAGQIGTTHALSRSAPRQGFSDLAAGPGQFAAAYYAEDENQTRIRLARFDLSGQPLDADPIELATGPRLRHPAVAFDGEHYLVVWQDDNVASFETDDQVYGRRVAPDGSIVDAAPFLVMEGRDPDVAANGGVLLVVASDASGDPDFRWVFAQRVDGGALVGGAQQIGANHARWPRVVPLGDGWVATWQRNPTHDNPSGSARAALVGPDGIGGPELSISSGSGLSGGGYGPRIASAGDSALVIWQTVDAVIGGRRVLSDGTLGAGFAITGAPALAAGPSVDFDGRDYLVAWEDYRDQVGLFDSRAHVYGGRVTESGALLDGAGGFPIADGVETEIQPAVASSFGASLVAWTEFVPDAPEATLRLRVRRESPWTYEGGGVGSPTEPALEVQGDLVSGTEVEVRVSLAPAGQAGWHVFGASALSLPFAGGVLVPNPNLVLAFTADGDGLAQQAVPVPSAITPGTPIHVQSWIFDPAAPSGWAATDAALSTAP